MSKLVFFIMIIAETFLLRGKDLDLDLLDQLDRSLESKDDALDASLKYKRKADLPTKIEADRKDYSRLSNIEADLLKIAGENAKISAEFAKLNSEILIKSENTKFVRVSFKLKEIVSRKLAELNVKLNGSSIGNFSQAELGLLGSDVLLYEGPMMKGSQRLDVEYKVFHKGEDKIELYQFQNEAELNVSDTNEFVVLLEIGENKNDLVVSEKAI